MNDFSSWKGIVRTTLAVVLFGSGVAFIRRLLLTRKGPLVRVLLVHHIKDPLRFERMISFLEKNYHIISPEDFLDQRFSSNKVNVLLTMDDGHRSWYREGLRVLTKYNFPALFFVSSGFLACNGDPEKTATYSRDNLKLTWTAEPLSYEELKVCANSTLITIGGHTVSHPALDQIPIESARGEITYDKQELESHVNQRLNFFAYPFGQGNYTKELKKLIQEAGYEYAMTTKSDFYRNGSDLFLIPRSNHGTVSPFLLQVWISGAFDIVFKIEDRIRALLLKKPR